MHPFHVELKDYFRDNGIRLKEVANLFKIKQSTLSQRIQSDKCISVESFLLLVKTYGYDMIELAVKYFGFIPMYAEEIREINELWENVNESMINIKKHHDNISEYIDRIDEIYQKYKAIEKLPLK